MNTMNTEICNECGRSVQFGSNLFVNRILDLNDLEEKIDQNKPFPIGEYICAECEEAINNQSVNVRDNITID